MELYDKLVDSFQDLPELKNPPVSKAMMPRTFTLKTLHIILEQVFMLANQHVY